MQSRFWVDKLKGLFQKSCFCSKVKMQNKFGMDKIQGSHKLEWLYVLFPVRIYFTSSKKVTDYLFGCVFKQKKYIMDENKPLSE